MSRVGVFPTRRWCFTLGSGSRIGVVRPARVLGHGTGQPRGLPLRGPARQAAVRPGTSNGATIGISANGDGGRARPGPGPCVNRSALTV